ncbi:MAG TPA: hypothetical protein VGE59_00640 [Patescibacteria group bacterium]
MLPWPEDPNFAREIDDWIFGEEDEGEVLNDPSMDLFAATAEELYYETEFALYWEDQQRNQVAKFQRMIEVATVIAQITYLYEYRPEAEGKMHQWPTQVYCFVPPDPPILN